jgi:hypothetical protein
MDGYRVVGVIAIPYPIFGVIINIVSKELIAYRVKIGNNPIAHVWASQKCHLRLWKGKGNG